MPGLFITFEGTEGCGKTTQTQLLAARLRARGCVVQMLREPGGTEIGEEIRHLLKMPRAGAPMTPEAELLLMNASRAQLVRELIRPALDRDEIVVCDRFHDSTEAYQGFGRGLDLGQLREVIAFTIGATRPDCTFLLEVPVLLSEARRQSRAMASGGAAEPDRFEASERAFFERVERGFHTIAARNPERIHRIDGRGSPEGIAAQVWGRVETLLRLVSGGVVSPAS